MDIPMEFERSEVRLAVISVVMARLGKRLHLCRGSRDKGQSLHARGIVTIGDALCRKEEIEKGKPKTAGTGSQSNIEKAAS
jgi:hypothetical protein